MSGIDRAACKTIAASDQGEDIRWFTEKLGFENRAGRPDPGIRFLTAYL